MIGFSGQVELFFTLKWKMAHESKLMHLTSLSQLCFCNTQFVCVCGKCYEVDFGAKGRFYEFVFSKQITEINFSSKAWKATMHIFFHSRIIRLKFSRVFYICVRRNHYFDNKRTRWIGLTFFKKLLLYRTITSKLNEVRM